MRSEERLIVVLRRTHFWPKKQTSLLISTVFILLDYLTGLRNFIETILKIPIYLFCWTIGLDRQIIDLSRVA